MTPHDSLLGRVRYKYGPFEEEHFPEAAESGESRPYRLAVLAAGLFIILLAGLALFEAGSLLLAAAGS